MSTRLRSGTIRGPQFVLAVLAVYTALRLFTTGVLLWITYDQQNPVVFSGDNPPYFDVATLWDGQWYEGIATTGYPGAVPVDGDGAVRQNAWAFYPIFPFLARIVMGLTGWPFAIAATVLATVLGYAAALVIAGMLRQQVGARAALSAVALLAAFPAAPVLQVAYTESLALLLLGAVLWLLIAKRWWVAAAVALVTGLTRPIALPLGLVALVAVIDRIRKRREEPIPGREWLAMAGSLVACGVSGLIWPFIAWQATGRGDAYPATMSAWRQGEPVVPFAPTIEVVKVVLGETRGPWLLAGVLVLLVVAVTGPWAARLGVELRTWCLGYPLYLFAALDPWTSIYRYLLLLFPLAVVMIGAGWADDHSRRPQPGWLLWVRTGTILVLFLGWQVWWAWELFMFVPPRDNPP